MVYRLEDLLDYNFYAVAFNISHTLILTAFVASPGRIVNTVFLHSLHIFTVVFLVFSYQIHVGYYGLEISTGTSKLFLNLVQFEISSF